MATALTIDSIGRTEVLRRRLALRILEGTLVLIFALLALSSLWLCAGLITQAWEQTALLHWLFPTGVGLFMALSATTAWLLMLPGLVSCVRDEFRSAARLFARVTAKKER